MLFLDKLEQKRSAIEGEFDKLFSLCIEKQTHPSELLLLVINGAYENTLNNSDLSPYVIGGGDEGFIEYTQEKFINWYKTSATVVKSYSEYSKSLEYSPERKKEIDRVREEEYMTVQFELMIYLKIWESDMLIKRLYQLVRTLNGESYDWHFKIALSNREDGATGTNQEVIRKLIRDKIETHSEKIYDSIKEAFVTQVRNAIAHSNFSFMGSHMQLYNDLENDPASQLKAIELSQWVDMFHSTLVIQNEVVGLFNRIKSYYASEARENNNLTEVRVCKANGDVEMRNVFYKEDHQEWVWESQIT